jgi:hypothetical protein
MPAPLSIIIDDNELNYEMNMSPTGKKYRDKEIQSYFQYYFLPLFEKIDASKIVKPEKLKEIINGFLDKEEYTFNESISIPESIGEKTGIRKTTTIPVHKLSSELSYTTTSIDSPTIDSPLIDSPLTDSSLTGSPLTGSSLTDSSITGSPLTGSPLTGSSRTNTPSMSSSATFESINSFHDKEIFFAKEYNFKPMNNDAYISCIEHILHEVIMQYLYFNISKIITYSEFSELIIIPELYKIKLTQNKDMFTVTIFMQYINEKSKIKYTNADIKRKPLLLIFMIRMITETFTIFEKFGIYHLDTGHRNVFFITVERRTKLAIIDFGTSIVEGEQRLPTMDGFPKKLISKNTDLQQKIFQLWEHTDNKNDYIDLIMGEEVFGGYKKRKTRKITKRKKSQKKKRHIKPTAARSLFSRKKA